MFVFVGAKLATNATVKVSGFAAKTVGMISKGASDYIAKKIEPSISGGTTSGGVTSGGPNSSGQTSSGPTSGGPTFVGAISGGPTSSGPTSGGTTSGGPTSGGSTFHNIIDAAHGGLLAYATIFESMEISAKILGQRWVSSTPFHLPFRLPVLYWNDCSISVEILDSY